jgi:hypothetical protein
MVSSPHKSCTNTTVHSSTNPVQIDKGCLDLKHDNLDGAVGTTGNWQIDKGIVPIPHRNMELLGGHQQPSPVAYEPTLQPCEYVLPWSPHEPATHGHRTRHVWACRSPAACGSQLPTSASSRHRSPRVRLEIGVEFMGERERETLVQLGLRRERKKETRGSLVLSPFLNSYFIF